VSVGVGFNSVEQTFLGKINFEMYARRARDGRPESQANGQGAQPDDAKLEDEAGNNNSGTQCGAQHDIQGAQPGGDHHLQGAGDGGQAAGAQGDIGNIHHYSLTHVKSNSPSFPDTFAAKINRLTLSSTVLEHFLSEYDT
jgi:hypothetical protein